MDALTFHPREFGPLTVGFVGSTCWPLMCDAIGYLLEEPAHDVDLEEVLWDDGAERAEVVTVRGEPVGTLHEPVEDRVWALICASLRRVSGVAA